MKRTTPTLSPAQNAYAVAKAQAQLTRARYDSLETAFIASRNLRNEDGTLPRHLWSWTNCEDDVWEAACEEFNASPGADEAFREAETAERALRDAENDLIHWGLTIPGLTREQREILQSACDPKSAGFRLRIREECISLALQWNGGAY